MGDFTERGDRTDGKVVRRTGIWEIGKDATGKRLPIL